MHADPQLTVHLPMHASRRNSDRLPYTQPAFRQGGYLQVSHAQQAVAHIQQLWQVLLPAGQQAGRHCVGNGRGQWAFPHGGKQVNGWPVSAILRLPAHHSACGLQPSKLPPTHRRRLNASSSSSNSSAQLAKCGGKEAWGTRRCSVASYSGWRSAGGRSDSETARPGGREGKVAGCGGGWEKRHMKCSNLPAMPACL